MCSISIKYDAKSMAWDILLVLTSVAGNLCNKCPSSYSNKTAVKVILSMQSLVSIEQQSPRRPCDSNIFRSVCQEFCPGGVLSKHALQVVSQHALQQVSGGKCGIPACLAGFQAHTQGGSGEGSGWGGLQAHTQVGS